MPSPESRDVALHDATSIKSWHFRLSCSAIALPAAVFLALYSRRPAMLGFYSDDWITFLHPRPGSLKSFSDLFALYNNRPVSALTVWLAEAIIRWEPARAQVLNLVLTATAACAVGWLCFSLTAAISARPGRLWGAGLASSAYLAAPWALGFSGWITAATAIAPATILFCIAASLLTGPRGERLSIQLLASLIMAGSFLAYESFYAQFIVVLVLAAMLTGKNAMNRMMLRPMLLLIAVNLACFLYNRSAGGVRKTFSEDWYHLFVNSYFRFAWLTFLPSFREVSSIVAVCSTIAVVLGFYFLSVRIGVTRAAVALIAVLVGIYGAGLFYAMAGYGLATVGTFARTTAVLTVHVSLLLGILGAASAADLAAGRSLARVQIVASIGLIAAFGVASSWRAADWARSWEVQSDVLARFPRLASATDAFDGALLYVGPLGPPTVPIATAPWEVTGAVAYALWRQSPEMGINAMTALWSANGDLPWFADMPNWSSTWDGKSFSQRMCEVPAVRYSKDAASLKIWRVGEEALELAPVGFHSGCDIPQTRK
jgi:hypothetical protein